MGLPPLPLPKEDQNDIPNKEMGDKEICKLSLASQKVILSLLQNDKI